MAAVLSSSCLAQAQAALAAADAGNCATCLGPVDGTLGSCAGIGACLSSYDDRPPHFLNPWEFEGTSDSSCRHLERVLRRQGASIDEAQDLYLQASFKGRWGTDVMEFLFAEGDSTVSLRGLPALGNPIGTRLLQQRFDGLRKDLGWDEVYVLRNRKRLLGVFESPFDSFGDIPPLQPDFDRPFDDQ